MAAERGGNCELTRMHETIAEHGVTIITATHDHKMLSVSDRIVWIRAGHVEKIRRTKDMAIKVGTIGT